MERWIIPQPLVAVEARMDDGARIVLRRHGNADGPRLVLSHGNGLSIDLYYPFWSLLADRFDLVLYDHRSHGWNPVSPRHGHNFATFVRDSQNITRAIDDQFGPKSKVGVFHSMSALTAMLHVRAQDDFAALVLFDPPVHPPGGAPDELEPGGRLLANLTRRRKSHFTSREEYVEILRRMRRLAYLLPGVIELFGDTNLRPAHDGGYELCCPLEHEAQIYEYCFGWAMEVPDSLEALTCPTKVIGGDPTILFSFLPSMDLRHLTALDYDFIPDATHFMQLEKPERCAALTVEFLETRGLA